MARHALILLLLLACPAQAATLYCGPSSTGNASGSDFNNLCALPNTTGFTRGDVYIIIEGSYGNRTFSEPASGTTPVTIRKASAANSGVTGYASTLHDGQAVFGELNLQTDYWVFDGVTRNETCTSITSCGWNDETAYGFRSSSLDANSAGGANGVACTDHLTVSYLAVSCGGSDCGRPMHMDPEDSVCEDWTISRSLFYNSGEIQLNATDNVVFEYVMFRELYGKEAIRAHGGGATNTIVRYSIFYNSCRDDNNPGEGCTAELGFFGDPGPDDFTGTQFYGNIVYKSMNQHKTDATFLVQAWCDYVGNNTIYDDSDSGTAQIYCTGGVVRNNIICRPNGINGGFSGSTSDNNSDYTSSCPFTNLAGGDLTLTGALAGSSTGSPAGNATDLTGETRGADGAWDRGAYEYAASSGPPAPTNIRIIGERDQLACWK